MSRVGLLLGAGASFELGMPLAWDLSRELGNWLTPGKLRSLNQQWRQKGCGHPEHVIEDFAGELANPETNYEAKLGYLQTQQRRQARDARHYNDLYIWAVQMVYALLYQRHVLNAGYFQRAMPFYRGLKDLAEAHHPLWVFSLNHDMMVECLAAQFGIPLSAGLTDRMAIPCRELDGSSAGDLMLESRLVEDIERQGFAFAQRGERSINLLKVHGGLDIFLADDLKKFIRILPRKSTPFGHIEAIRMANENLYYDYLGQRVQATNEITYADHNGELQFLRRSLLAGAYKFKEPATQVLPEVMLKQFRVCLNQVSELVCIGYGFGDQHINDALQAWLEFTSHRKLVSVSPGPFGTPNFLSHISSQFSHRSMMATDFFETHSSQPLNFAEKLGLQMLRNARDNMRKARGFA